MKVEKLLTKKSGETVYLVYDDIKDEFFLYSKIEIELLSKHIKIDGIDLDKQSTRVVEEDANIDCATEYTEKNLVEISSTPSEARVIEDAINQNCEEKYPEKNLVEVDGTKLDTLSIKTSHNRLDAVIKKEKDNKESNKGYTAKDHIVGVHTVNQIIRNLNKDIEILSKMGSMLEYLGDEGLKASMIAKHINSVNKKMADTSLILNHRRQVFRVMIQKENGELVGLSPQEYSIYKYYISNAFKGYDTAVADLRLMKQAKDRNNTELQAVYNNRLSCNMVEALKLIDTMDRDCVLGRVIKEDKIVVLNDETNIAYKEYSKIVGFSDICKQKYTEKGRLALLTYAVKHDKLKYLYGIRDTVKLVDGIIKENVIKVDDAVESKISYNDYIIYKILVTIMDSVDIDWITDYIEMHRCRINDALNKASETAVDSNLKNVTDFLSLDSQSNILIGTEIITKDVNFELYNNINHIN